jgi:uncharacterized membrane protein YgcG
MSRAKALLLALAGLLLPVGLALGVYLTSAGSLAAVPTVIEPLDTIARSATTTEPTETTTEQGTTTTETTGGDDDRNDDLPGKCEDPDHRLDPDCDPRTAQDDDSSGHGSGSGEDSSGSGSGGGGGGDSSGPGGGGGSSGPGSGDDD